MGKGGGDYILEKRSERGYNGDKKSERERMEGI